MMKIRDIERGSRHDDILKASLLERLSTFDILGPGRKLNLDMFRHDSIQQLRERVAAQEQLQAKGIVTDYLQGPREKKAFVGALVKLSELAGEPLKRHFNAVAGAAKLNGGRATFQHDEARADSRDIIMAGLSSLKEKLPILTDVPVANADEKLRFAKKWWLINPVDNIDRDDVSLSIALIDHGRPVAGVVHMPKLNRTYAGIVSEQWATARVGKAKPRKITTKTRDRFKTVAATVHGDRKSSAFRTTRDSHSVKRTFTDTTAPYGLCRLAQGTMDIYLHKQPLSQATLAAAHAIVVAAGGVVQTQRTGQPVVYGNTQTTHLTTPGFVAASSEKILKMQDVQRLVA